MYTNGFRRSGDRAAETARFDRRNPALRRLGRALDRSADPVACERCRAALPDYVEAQLRSMGAGGNAPGISANDEARAMLVEVATHLDVCPDCAELYLRLFEAEQAVASGDLGSAEHTPAPDLGFLPAKQPDLSDAVARWWDAAARRLADRLRVSFTPDLLGQLVPAPATQAVRGAGGAPGRYHERLYTLDPCPGYPMSLAVFRDGLQPDRALVEVMLHYPGRGWPELGGIEVALGVDGETRRAATDPAGLAVFEGVPIAGLGCMTIELPLPGGEGAVEA